MADTIFTGESSCLAEYITDLSCMNLPKQDGEVPVSGIELSLENRRWESKSQINLSRCNIPEQDIPVCRRGWQLVSALIPTE